MGRKQSIFTVDSHTQGNPTRVVVGGIPAWTYEGKDMAEKTDNFSKRGFDIRKALMCEPRGHRDMCGCILTDPVSTEGDYGVLFMDNFQFLNMSGHSVIGVGTTLVETGLFEPDAKEFINLDTPAGLVRLKAKVEGGKVTSICLRNVPSFVEVLDGVLDVPGFGQVTYDITFGGNYFALFHADQFSIRVAPENTSILKKIGMELKDLINDKHKVKHPTLEHINNVDIVTFIDKPLKQPKAMYKNVHIFCNSQADRSPGGTGTTAVLTMLFAKKKIGINEDIYSEGLAGGVFKGRVLEETFIGDRPALNIEICGSATITGYHHFVIDSDDELGKGFVIS